MTTAKKKLRILHAPIHALYQTSLQVLGLRRLGHHVDCMCQASAVWSDFFRELNPIVLGNSDISSQSLHFMAHALENYDVFHLHSGYGFFFNSTRGNQLALLKKAGKTVVMSRWGCRDGRTPSSFFEDRGLCDICPVPLTFCNDASNRERLENEEQYVDVLINHEPDFHEFNKNSVYVPGAIDTEMWKPGLSIPDEHAMPPLPDGTLRVLHAVGGSNRGNVKGSDEIRRAIDALKAKGLRIEYEAVQGKSFSDLRYSIERSDIVVDQLLYKAFGSFAREAMSLGKPVIGNVDPHLRESMPDLPILNATPDTVGEALEGLIVDEARRKAMGRASREYALKEFDMDIVARRLENIYVTATGRGH